MGMLIQKTGSFLFCCQRNCVVLGDVYHALKIVFFFNFGCSGSWCFVRAFSLVAVGVRGATLGCSSWASRCRGFFCCGAQALGHGP